jgi:hypothetical protein
LSIAPTQPARKPPRHGRRCEVCGGPLWRGSCVGCCHRTAACRQLWRKRYRVLASGDSGLTRVVFVRKLPGGMRMPDRARLAARLARDCAGGGFPSGRRLAWTLARERACIAFSRLRDARVLLRSDGSWIAAGEGALSLKAFCRVVRLETNGRRRRLHSSTFLTWLTAWQAGGVRALIDRRGRPRGSRREFDSELWARFCRRVAAGVSVARADAELRGLWSRLPRNRWASLWTLRQRLRERAERQDGQLYLLAGSLN